MVKRTALVFGASGLTGSHLSKLLEEDGRYGKIKLFVRKPLPFLTGEKTEILPADFSSPEKIALCFQSSPAPEQNQNITAPANENIIDLFCCLGTTLSKAGSREAFRYVDYHLPLKLAETGQAAGVSSFVAVSSVGADEKSFSFYLKTKGEMERDIAKIPFIKTGFLRPSFLLGERNEYRFGEIVGTKIVRLFNPVMVGNLKKYRGINARDVAKAMIEIANGNYREKIFESDRIQEIADKRSITQ